MRLGVLRARARVIERDLVLHTVANIFKPGQEIEVVLATDFEIHEEILVNHCVLLHDEEIERGQLSLHKIEGVLGSRNPRTDVVKKYAAVDAERHGTPRH